MWKDDNDKLQEFFVDKTIEKFPAICPVCKKNAAHMYMHVYNNATRRGGLWVWCSECKIFSHCSGYVPEYWENCPLVEMEKLCAIPDYLDEIRDIIDAHVSAVRSSS